MRLRARIDPFHLGKHDFCPEFFEIARKVNQSSPEFCVGGINPLNDARMPVKDSKIPVLAASYPPGVGDTRESLGAELLEILNAEMSPTTYYDAELPEPGLNLAMMDIAAIANGPPEFDYEQVGAGEAKVVDSRG